MTMLLPAVWGICRAERCHLEPLTFLHYLNIWVLGMLEFPAQMSLNLLWGLCSFFPTSTLSRAEVSVSVDIHIPLFLCSFWLTTLYITAIALSLQHSQFSLFVSLFHSIQHHLTYHIIYLFIILLSGIFHKRYNHQNQVSLSVLPSVRASTPGTLAVSKHSVNTC